MFISLRAIFTHTLQARVSVCTKLNYFVYTQHFPGSGSGWVSKRMSVFGERVTICGLSMLRWPRGGRGINVVFLLPCSSPRFLDRTSGIIRTFCRFHVCVAKSGWGRHERSSGLARALWRARRRASRHASDPNGVILERNPAFRPCVIPARSRHDVHGTN